jgi:hypothetical protein
MEPAYKLALASSGLFLLFGMLTGIWKYLAIRASDKAEAPYYVSIAHRTALMYAFACLVLAEIGKHSAFDATVDFWATLFPIIFFALAVAMYVLHGFLNDTDNQLRKPHRLGPATLPGLFISVFMWALIAAETGGFAILLYGCLETLYFTST